MFVYHLFLGSREEDQAVKDEQPAYQNEGLRNIKMKYRSFNYYHKFKNYLVPLDGSILVMSL